jgi:hypothetical protein
LTIPIKLTGRNFNPYLNYQDLEIAQYYFSIDIWCKNEDYMPIIEIDTKMVFPGKPFKFIDVSMLLPEGMWLHRKYDNILYNSIVTMGQNFNYVISSTLFPSPDPTIDLEKSNEEVEEDEVSDETKQFEAYINQSKESQQTKKKKKQAMPIAVASSKKLLQVKSEGADNKSLRKLIAKGPVDKKGAKKPEKKSAPAEETPKA